MKQIGAASILTTMLFGLLAWGGNTLNRNSEAIATLKAREISHKELIMRVDNKVDKIDNKLDKVLIRIK